MLKRLKKLRQLKDSIVTTLVVIDLFYACIFSLFDIYVSLAILLSTIITLPIGIILLSKLPPEFTSYDCVSRAEIYISMMIATLIGLLLLTLKILKLVDVSYPTYAFVIFTVGHISLLYLYYTRVKFLIDDN